MNLLDLPRLIEDYNRLELGWKIAAPFLAALVCAATILLSAQILASAVSSTGREEYSFGRCLGIATLHFLLFAPATWAVLKFVTAPNALKLGFVPNLALFGIMVLIIDLILLFAFLTLMGKLSQQETAVTSVWRLGINLHLAMLAIGIYLLGANLFMDSPPFWADVPFLRGMDSLAVLGGVTLLAFLAGPALYSASALAGAETLTMLRALALGWVELIVLVPVTYLLRSAVPDAFPQWNSAAHGLAIGIIVALLSLAIVTVGVWRFGGATPGIAALAWLFRLPFHALVLSLATKDPSLVILPSIIAFLALILQGSGKMAGQEDFTYSRSLLIIIPVAVVATTMLWLFLRFVIEPNTQSWSSGSILGAIGGFSLAVDLAAIVAGLIVIARMPAVRSAIAWLYRFVIQLHLVGLVFGLFMVGLSYLTLTVSLPETFSFLVGFQLLLVGVISLLIAMSGPVLWTAGVLTGAEKLSPARALLIAWIELAVFIPLYHFGMNFVTKQFPDWEPMRHYLAIGGAIGLTSLVLMVPALMFASGISLGMAVLTWVIRLPLIALLAALVAGLEFIGLSIVQSALEPSGAVLLQRIGLIFEATVGAGLLVFFASTANRPSVTGLRRAV